jgi:uncharacterized membrane protein YfcA
MGLKSIFDGLYIDQLIQKNDQGEFILYPHGLMGRGYLLPADREPAIRQRLRLTMLLSLIVGTMYGLFALRVVESSHVGSLLGWLLVIAIAVLLVGGILFYQSRLADGLEPVRGKQPSTGEWLRRGRQARPTWTYWVSAVAGVLLLLMSVAAIAVGMSDNDHFIVGCGVFLVLVSVLGAWDGLLGLKERSRS